MSIRGKPNRKQLGEIKGVPLEVLWQYEEARQIGECNMFDTPCLRSMCYSYSFHHLLNYIESKGTHFMDGIPEAYSVKEVWWQDDEEGDV